MVVRVEVLVEASVGLGVEVGAVAVSAMVIVEAKFISTEYDRHGKIILPVPS